MSKSSPVPSVPSKRVDWDAFADKAKGSVSDILKKSLKDVAELGEESLLELEHIASRIVVYWGRKQQGNANAGRILAHLEGAMEGVIARAEVQAVRTARKTAVRILREVADIGSDLIPILLKLL